MKEILTHTHTLTMDFLGNVTSPQTATESPSDVPMDDSTAETLGACRERKRGSGQHAVPNTRLAPAYQDSTYHAVSPSPEVPPTCEAKRKRSVGTGAAPRAKLKKFVPPALGANGRPIVLANVKYSVDLAALKEYAATEEAGHTKASRRMFENRTDDASNAPRSDTLQGHLRS